METTHLRPSAHDLPADVRAKVVAILNAQLGLLSDAASQARQAHWNVRGPRFLTLHELFEKVAETFESPLDDLAERVTALGGIARGTIRLAAAGSPLEDFPLEPGSDVEFVSVLRDRVAVVARSLRAGIDETATLGDAVSSDLLTGLAADADKMLWFLDAHLG